MVSDEMKSRYVGLSDTELERQYVQAVNVIQAMMERAEFMEDLMRTRNLEVPQVLDNGDTNGTIPAKE